MSPGFSVLAYCCHSASFPGFRAPPCLWHSTWSFLSGSLHVPPPPTSVSLSLYFSAHGRVSRSRFIGHVPSVFTDFTTRYDASVACIPSSETQSGVAAEVILQPVWFFLQTESGKTPLAAAAECVRLLLRRTCVGRCTVYNLHRASPLMRSSTLQTACH